jgi:hypothetical protein
LQLSEQMGNDLYGEMKDGGDWEINTGRRCRHQAAADDLGSEWPEEARQELGDDMRARGLEPRFLSRSAMARISGAAPPDPAANGDDDPLLSGRGCEGRRVSALLS